MDTAALNAGHKDSVYYENFDIQPSYKIKKDWIIAIMCLFIKGLFELVLFILNLALFLAGGAAAGLGCLSLLKVSAMNEIHFPS